MWFCLFSVAVRARFIHARHGETTVRFHYVRAVRIVALDAVHFAFKDRVMLRQMELGIGGDMALETGFGLFAGIDDETATAHCDVSAGRSVT